MDVGCCGEDFVVFISDGVVYYWIYGVVNIVVDIYKILILIVGRVV